MKNNDNNDEVYLELNMGFSWVNKLKLFLIQLAGTVIISYFKLDKLGYICIQNNYISFNFFFLLVKRSLHYYEEPSEKFRRLYWFQRFGWRSSELQAD